MATSPDILSVDHILEVLAAKVTNRIQSQSHQILPRLLTLNQAAEYLGRTHEAMQHLASSGKIPTVRTDRRVFVDRMDLDRWIEHHKSAAF